MDYPIARIEIGDCLEVLKTLPDQSVHCCVTSPPYWGLRDYGTGQWKGGTSTCDHRADRTIGVASSTLEGGKKTTNHQQEGYRSVCRKCGAVRVDKQLGLEKTPEEYVAKLVEVFREVRRVLRDDGTAWVNLGDSWFGSWANYGGGNRGAGKQRPIRKGSQAQNPVWEGLEDYRPAATFKHPVLKPKDVCGIPWRVAFALQAPYEHHLIPSIADRAWLAAMIDGEGCITIPECKSGHESGSSFPPIIQIRMCDTQCLEKCISLTGKGGNLNKQLPPSYAEANQRAVYQWRINGVTVAAVLADVYPFLLIKRKQACVAWTLQQIRDSYETKRGVPIPEVLIGKQQECRRLISRLNQREAVDLPTWIEEPKFIVEPGWYLRQDCIWHKPNPMPESVTDRCTKAHEYIFLLSKKARYYYDADAIKTPCSDSYANDRRWETGPTEVNYKEGYADAMAQNPKKPHGVFNGEKPYSVNRRSVWTVTTASYKDAHFATFPPKLIEPCILAGCPKSGTVLDPFAGSGTTGEVALRLGRSALLIELNPEYGKLIEKRCEYAADRQLQLLPKNTV